jgi:predicted phosphodiesterase
MKIEASLVLSDLQIPFEDPKSLSAVEKYMASRRWDRVVYIGDFIDFDMVSSFNKGAPRRTQGRYIKGDYDYANKILDRHQAIVRKRNPKAEFVLLEGNHEERIERYIDEHPELQGMFEVEEGLRLKQRGIKWVRSWSKGETYQVGKAYFTHGLYTNQYHAKKMADAFGTTIIYGHTHDMMSIPRVIKTKQEIHVGQSIGCLCEYDQAYMKGKPSNWQQGFAVFFTLPNGNFTYYTPRIFEHQFIGPDGVLYTPSI